MNLSLQKWHTGRGWRIPKRQLKEWEEKFYDLKIRTYMSFLKWHFLFICQPHKRNLREVNKYQINRSRDFFPVQFFVFFSDSFLLSPLAQKITPFLYKLSSTIHTKMSDNHVFFLLTANFRFSSHLLSDQRKIILFLSVTRNLSSILIHFLLLYSYLANSTTRPEF
jgi:hypothetical protein